MVKIVKCINPTKHLTEGKYYTVDFETENTYRIKDDKGNFPTYNKRRFEIN